MAHRRAYVIPDPLGDYARAFIQTAFSRTGLRPICVYTDPKERFYGERRDEFLQVGNIEAAYDLTDLDELCRDLTDRYDIAGVIPHSELTVGLAADLLERLDIDWVLPSTLRRFRDKAALKDHLRASGAVRLPYYRRITTVDEMDLDASLPDRIVVKPNDGYGNKRVGVFDSADRNAIHRHLQSEPDGQWIVEEFVDGVEYNVNGHVRTDGRVMLRCIDRYVRTSMNGCDTVYDTERQLLSTDPAFEELHLYARDVLDASGLRRSPFHLEAIIDRSGPCLIDLGARFGGYGQAYQMSRSHPTRLSSFDVAVLDYLGPNDADLEPIDWAEHDRHVSLVVYGLAHSEATIFEIDGLAAVRAMPEFIACHSEPHVGDHVLPTTELNTAPFVFELEYDGTELDAARLAEFVRSTVTWNARASRARPHLARFTRKLSRVRRRVGWAIHGIRRRALREPQVQGA